MTTQNNSSQDTAEVIPTFDSGYSFLAESDEIKKMRKEQERIRKAQATLFSAQKNIIGSAVLAECAKNKDFTRQLIAVLTKQVTKDSEKGKIFDVVNNLRQSVGMPKLEKPKADTASNASQSTQTLPSTNTPPHPQNG